MVAFDFSNSANWAKFASGLGQALSSRARGGTLGEGMSQGLMGYDQRQDAEVARQMQEQQFAWQKEDVAAKRTENQRKLQAWQRIESMLSGSDMAGVPMRDGGMRAPVGGIQTASAPNPLAASIPDNVRKAILLAGPDKGPDMLAEYFMAPPKEAEPNKTRQIHRNGMIIDQEFDTKSGKWTDVGQGPQFAPQQPKEPKAPGIITMHNPKTGEAQSMFDNDPKIAGMLTGGWIEGAQTKGSDGPKPASPKDLRDEYTKANKDYEQSLYGYNKVVSAANDPSPAGDIALIFGYMKTLDPNSTVREGEFATAQQAGGVPERVVALYNQVLNGTRLTGDQRKDFATQARSQFGVYQARKSQLDTFYSGLAERSNISPQDVLVPYGDVMEYAPPPGPAPAQGHGGRGAAAPAANPYQSKYGLTPAAP